jgi:hypothetical protein
VLPGVEATEQRPGDALGSFEQLAEAPALVRIDVEPARDQSDPIGIQLCGSSKHASDRGFQNRLGGIGRNMGRRRDHGGSFPQECCRRQRAGGITR